MEARAHAGGTVRLALRVQLPEGLHAQSNKPRDPSLIPTTLTFDAPAGMTVTEVVFPAPTDFTLQGSDQPLSVFARDFVIGVQLAVARDLAPGPHALPARIRYQVCNDSVCFRPVTADVRWDLQVVPRSDTLTREHADVFARIAFGTGQPPAAAAPAAPTEPAAPTAPTAPTAPDLSLFTIRASAGGYMDRATFLKFIHDAEAGVVAKGWFEGRGPLAILLLVFVGGLALNLTPCVLPMIPINLAIIGAGARAGTRGRGLLLGAVYGGAMALVYGVLGVVVILTAGTFGTINASPWFNVGIAALFVVLGLAMFDIIAIDFSRFSSGLSFGAGRGTFLLAFSMGAVAALLAGACVAPVVIQVVLFSSNLYATGTRSALALPFLLGLGMALPWPIAGAGLAALPKPGAWMERVKQVFGVFILATAAYYGYLGYELFANRWVDPSTVQAGVAEKLKEGWHASLADGLREAERDGKPVLIDMWATWCKNCFTMDKTTLADPEVTAALAGYVRIKFQAENPDESPAKDLMNRVGAIGLPTYVILQPSRGLSVPVK